MNSFMKVVCLFIVLGCIPFSSHVTAMSDENPAYSYDDGTLKALKIIFKKRISLINFWKSGFIMLEDSQGKPVDMIEFIKYVEKYLFEKESQLDENKVTADNMDKALRLLGEVK